MHPTALRLCLPLVAALLATAPARATGNLIVMKNFDFSPMNVVVARGTTVTWKNLDGEPHTVVSVDGKFRSPALDQNDAFSFRFVKSGTYKYLCSIHPRMRAVVTVK